MLTGRAFPLWTVAVALGVMAVVFTELRLGGASGYDTDRIVGFAIFCANVAVALLGIWKRSRVVWAVYLVLSLALMALIGANTPISALWTMARAKFAL